MFEFESKHYEPRTDDLFLVYTAIDDSFNANGWRVEDIDKNITSGLGRPGVIKPKDHTNPNDTNQDGNFVHPTFPNASLSALLQNQETYTIARAVRLDKPSKNGSWRVWLQVTDPKAKAALQQKNASIDSTSGDTTTSYPRYISPQVITFPASFPEEERAQSYKHWIISHWAFVDIPAYGEKMQVRGNCYGDLTNCKIKLQNASTANFCVTQAINTLLHSSHNANSSINNIMSETNTAGNNQNPQSVQPISPGQIYTWSQQPVQTNQSQQPIQQPAVTPQQQQQVTPSKQEPAPDSNPRPGQPNPEDVKNYPDSPKQEEDKEASSTPLLDGLPKTIPELQQLAKTQNEIIKDLQKGFSELKKDNEARKKNELKWAAASKVSRYHNYFKSREAFDKEVDTVVRYGQVMSEQEVEDYLRSKYSTALMPVAKSASKLDESYHTVPEFQQNNASSNSSDNNRKLVSLIDMLDNGGL